MSADLGGASPSRSRVVATLTFSADGIPMALAASAVGDMVAPGPDGVHIAELLGLQSPGPDRAAEQRAFLLGPGEAGYQVIVEGPVNFWSVTPNEIVRHAGTLPLQRMVPLAGFALNDEGQIVTLLDSSALVAILRRRSQEA